MKNPITLAFIPEIESCKINCLRVVTHKNVTDMHQNFCEYIHLFTREIDRMLSRVFNLSDEEIHPDTFKNFISQANVYVDAMANCHKAICHILDPENQALTLDADVLRHAQLAYLEEKITTTHIRDCILSEEELWHRFAKGTAIISAKILITIAATGAMSVYIVPYFLISGASTAAAIAVYGAANSVASGVSAVACNAIDGKNGMETLENVPTSMLRGAISGGIFGGISTLLNYTDATLAIATLSK